MARTELPHGVILPAEYSDDWYEDMTSNLTKLDDVIGSDSEKLNSNDVAFLRMSSAALTDGGTGNFSDLNSSNKLKTGDYVLDSGRKLYQVVSVDSTNETFTVGNSLFKITAESDLAPVAESGDYDDLDNKPDLNPYDQHIVNTDIHVTTADKTKWNNGVTQAYVFRYSGTAVVPNSTIAYSTIDNTDNIKSGDKILDVDGKLFEITAVDTANQTVTVGSALIDLALDANVVHTSGNENVAGIKNFTDNTYVKNINFTREVASTSSSNTSILQLINTITYTDQTADKVAILNFRITADGVKALYPNENNQYLLGLTSRKWSEVHGVTYYYGSSDVEFSDKFVTTDTNQTVGGEKTFSDGMGLNSWLYFTNSSVTKGTIPQSTVSPYRIYFGSDVNYGNSLFNIDTSVSNTGVQTLTLRSAENVVNGDDTRLGIIYDPTLSQPRCIKFKGDCVPTTSDTYECGTNSNKWKSFNGLEPSSLGMPDLNNGVDISGYITLDTSSNNYTPIANGWICIKGVASGNSGIYVESTNGFYCSANNLVDINSTARIVLLSFPVVKNEQYTIVLKSVNTSVTAKFFPCQGNI